jgi:hypothetical protein
LSWFTGRYSGWDALTVAVCVPKAGLASRTLASMAVRDIDPARPTVGSVPARDCSARASVASYCERADW